MKVKKEFERGSRYTLAVSDFTDTEKEKILLDGITWSETKNGLLLQGDSKCDMSCGHMIAWLKNKCSLFDLY